MVAIPEVLYKNWSDSFMEWFCPVTKICCNCYVVCLNFKGKSDLRSFSNMIANIWLIATCR